MAGLEVQMRKAAEEMEFEKAAQLRDRILSLKEMQLGVKSSRIGIKGLLGSGAVAAAEALGGARGQRSAARRRRR